MGLSLLLSVRIESITFIDSCFVVVCKGRMNCDKKKLCCTCHAVSDGGLNYEDGEEVISFSWDCDLCH